MFLVLMFWKHLPPYDRLLDACSVYTHEYMDTEQVSGSGSWHNTACRMLPVTFQSTYVHAQVVGQHVPVRHGLRRTRSQHVHVCFAGLMANIQAELHSIKSAMATNSRCTMDITQRYSELSEQVEKNRAAQELLKRLSGYSSSSSTCLFLIHMHLACLTKMLTCEHGRSPLVD